MIREKLIVSVVGVLLGCLGACLLVEAGEAEVLINEILYHPPIGLDDAEFVEIFPPLLSAISSAVITMFPALPAPLALLAKRPLGALRFGRSTS